MNNARIHVVSCVMHGSPKHQAMHHGKQHMCPFVHLGLEPCSLLRSGPFKCMPY